MSSGPFNNEQQGLLRAFLESGAILTGNAVRQRCGLHSPIYIDLRQCIYNHPELLWSVGRQFASKIAELSRDSTLPQCVVGIPDTATPLALTTALYAWQNRVKPEIFFGMLRKEPKTYPGLPPSYWVGQPARDCEYNLIDDVVASGLTKRDAAAKMQTEGILLRRIVVLFDREQGDGLRAEGFDLHAIFQLPQVVDFYLEQGLLRREEHDEIIQFLRRRQFAPTPAGK